MSNRKIITRSLSKKISSDDDYSDEESDCDSIKSCSEKFEYQVIEKLSKELKGVSKKKIKCIVENCIGDVGANVVDDYFYFNRRDEWKRGLKYDEIIRLEPQLKKLKREIEDEKPTVKKILTANMSKESKKEALKIYNIMEFSDKFTIHYLELEEKLNNIIRSSMFKLNTQIPRKILHTTNTTEMINSLQTTDNIKKIILQKYLEMQNLDSSSNKHHSIKEWLNWAIKLPYNKKAEEEKDLSKVRRRLDRELYGMDDVKDSLIEIVNNRRSGRDVISQFGLYGLPGCGKTSIAKALAKALKLPFSKISFGGMTDSCIIKGSDQVWVGATPSIFLKKMAEQGCCNGVILLDEIDKIKNQIENALLHATDSSHNDSFEDTYMCEFTHDLSNLWFIYSANDISTISPALKDRIPFNKVRKYTGEEISKITKSYVLVKSLKNVGMRKKDVVLTDDAIEELKRYAEKSNESKESIRTYEKYVSNIISKINMLRTNTKLKSPIKLPYTIDNFSLPITLNSNHINTLMKNTLIEESKHIMMYM